MEKVYPFHSIAVKFIYFDLVIYCNTGMMKQLLLTILFLVSVNIFSKDYSYDWFFSHIGNSNEICAPGISDPGMTDSIAAFKVAEFRAKSLLALMYCSYVGDLTTINMGNANSGYSGTETDIEIIHTSKIIARLPDSCGIEFTEEGYTENGEAMVLAKMTYHVPDSLIAENLEVTITRNTSLTPNSAIWPEHSDLIVIEAHNQPNTLLYKHSIDLKRKEAQTEMEDSSIEINRRLVFGKCQYKETEGRSIYGSNKGSFAINSSASTGNGLWSALMENVIQGISMATSLMESSHNLLVSTGIQNTSAGNNSISNTEFLQSAKNYSLNKVSPTIKGIKFSNNKLYTNIGIVELNGNKLPRKPGTGAFSKKTKAFYEELEDDGWSDYFGNDMDGVTGAIWDYLQLNNQYISANNTIAATNINTALLMSLEMSKLKLANSFNAQRYMLTNSNTHTEEVSTTKSAKALTKANLNGIYPYYFLERTLSNGYAQVKNYIFLDIGQLKTE